MVHREPCSTNGIRRQDVVVVVVAFGCEIEEERREERRKGCDILVFCDEDYYSYNQYSPISS